MMALATLNGSDLVAAKIWLPKIGAWTADLVVDSTVDAPAGRATLVADGGLTLQGTVYRGGSWLETVYLRLVAGAGGMAKQAIPKFYAAASVGVVLKDLLATAGETLSPTAQAAVLGTRLASWTTIAQPIGAALEVLVARGAPAGTSWRFLTDGTLWVGAETWPDCGLKEPDDYVEIDDFPQDGKIDLGVTTPRLLPGTTITGRRVSFVEHVIRDGHVRTRPLLEAA